MTPTLWIDDNDSLWIDDTVHPTEAPARHLFTRDFSTAPMRAWGRRPPGRYRDICKNRTANQSGCKGRLHTVGDPRLRGGGPVRHNGRWQHTQGDRSGQQYQRRALGPAQDRSKLYDDICLPEWIRFIWVHVDRKNKMTIRSFPTNTLSV